MTKTINFKTERGTEIKATITIEKAEKNIWLQNVEEISINGTKQNEKKAEITENYIELFIGRTARILFPEDIKQELFAEKFQAQKIELEKRIKTMEKNTAWEEKQKQMWEIEESGILS